MKIERNTEPFLKLRISNRARSETFVDAMTIVKECNYETDDKFFYVYFDESSKIAKKLFNIVWGWSVQQRFGLEEKK